jgi:transposase
MLRYEFHASRAPARRLHRGQHCRRVASRYHELAAHHLAFVKPASILIWLRAN